MQNTHFWNQFNLSGKKIIFSLLLLSFLCIWADQANAQIMVKRKGSLRNPRVGNFTQQFSGAKESRKFHYGFFVGINNNRFNATVSENFTSGQLTNLVAIQPKYSMGFSLGFLVSMNLSTHWDLRFTPGVAFAERSLDFQYHDIISNTDTTINKNIENTMVELPFVVRFKSQMRGSKERPWCMYMVAGVKPAINITGQKDADPTLLRVNPFDLSIEYGFGFDKKYQYFRFVPEIRFSYGIMNRLVQDDNRYSLGLKNLSTNTVSLIFHFQ